MRPASTAGSTTATRVRETLIPRPSIPECESSVATGLATNLSTGLRAAILARLAGRPGLRRLPRTQVSARSNHRRKGGRSRRLALRSRHTSCQTHRIRGDVGGRIRVRLRGTDPRNRVAVLASPAMVTPHPWHLWTQTAPQPELFSSPGSSTVAPSCILPMVHGMRGLASAFISVFDAPANAATSSITPIGVAVVIRTGGTLWSAYAYAIGTSSDGQLWFRGLPKHPTAHHFASAGPLPSLRISPCKPRLIASEDCARQSSRSGPIGPVADPYVVRTEHHSRTRSIHLAGHGLSTSSFLFAESAGFANMHSADQEP